MYGKSKIKSFLQCLLLDEQCSPLHRRDAGAGTEASPVFFGLSQAVHFPHLPPEQVLSETRKKSLKKKKKSLQPGADTQHRKLQPEQLKFGSCREVEAVVEQSVPDNLSNRLCISSTCNKIWHITSRGDAGGEEQNAFPTYFAAASTSVPRDGAAISTPVTPSSCCFAVGRVLHHSQDTAFPRAACVERAARGLFASRGGLEAAWGDMKEGPGPTQPGARGLS